METKSSFYSEDFYSWTYEQADLIKKGKFDALDTEHLIEELEDLGNCHYDQLESRLAQLIAHLLKWQIQYWKQTNSWRATIRIQRKSIEKLLRRNPGLKARLTEALTESWSEARDIAIAETDLPDKLFPAICPYTLDEILNSDFWPDS